MRKKELLALIQKAKTSMSSRAEAFLGDENPQVQQLRTTILAQIEGIELVEQAIMGNNAGLRIEADA